MYCSQHLSPHSIKLRTELKGIRRNPANQNSSTQQPGYRDNLKEESLSSLERKSVRYALRYIWKILETLYQTLTLKVTQTVERSH